MPSDNVQDEIKIATVLASVGQAPLPSALAAASAWLENQNQEEIELIVSSSIAVLLLSVHSAQASSFLPQHLGCSELHSTSAYRRRGCSASIEPVLQQFERLGAQIQSAQAPKIWQNQTPTKHRVKGKEANSFIECRILKSSDTRSRLESESTAIVDRSQAKRGLFVKSD